LLGILVPLGLLYLLNWLTTKFLPLEQTVRAEYPVQILNGATAKIVDKDGNPIRVEANDFKFLPHSPASRSQAAGAHGTSVAKVAKFPLLPSWFEHEATAGNRLISLYSESGKGPSHFRDGKATEVSPNLAANWFLSIPDGEFSKASGETMNGTLVVASRMGSLPSYQSRVQDVSVKPGLQGRIDEIRAAINSAKPDASANPAKMRRAAKAGKSAIVAEAGFVPTTLPSVPGAPGIPGVPGSPTPPPSTIPGVPGSPGIPGAPPLTSIPGAPSTPPVTPPSIPGAPNNIPGINPPNQ
jgi:hypothetical protein